MCQKPRGAGGGERGASEVPGGTNELTASRLRLGSPPRLGLSVQRGTIRHPRSSSRPHGPGSGGGRPGATVCVGICHKNVFGALGPVPLRAVSPVRSPHPPAINRDGGGVSTQPPLRRDRTLQGAGPNQSLLWPTVETGHRKDVRYPPRRGGARFLQHLPYLRIGCSPPTPRRRKGNPTPRPGQY